MQETFNISLTTDPDGFILQKCPKCGNHFKLTPDDIEADDIIEIWCPSCGLISKNYIPDDVNELALKMIHNALQKDLANFGKSLTKKSNSFMKITTDFKPKYEEENPITSIIDALVVQKYKCCNREAKIDLILKTNGSYCPFCGVLYENK